MASLKLYLDSRSIKKDKTCPLKISLSKNGKSALLSLGISILPSQWNPTTCKIVNHPNRAFLNNYLSRRILDVESDILSLETSAAGLDALGLKKLLQKKMKERALGTSEDYSSRFANCFLHFAESKSARTKEIYLTTFNRIKAFDPYIDEKSFNDINKDWLVSFDAFLSKTAPSPNARAIHLRNIRAVFNDAIDNDVTSCYPFRKFKIKYVKTQKRALSVDDLRLLFGYPVEPFQQKYIDLFKLCFFLIGINAVDLLNAKTENIVNGRLEYRRAKTQRLYSIKLEPEALKIIEAYQGKSHLLSVLDRYADYRNFLKRLNDNLQMIGPVNIGKQGKKTRKPIFPELTTYWARHTWATIAARLEIPKETIAAALGHGGNSVTDIYIDFDREKVDRANRAVIDFVLYGK